MFALRRLTQRVATGMARCVVPALWALDEGDFFGRESMEFTDPLVNLPVGGGYTVSQRSLFCIR